MGGVTADLPFTIFLVGFMASGKSTVGPVLAASFNCPFIDLDRSIEARSQCSIAELIAREGESGFRRIETETLSQTLQGPRAVIAPGGGAITIAENLRLMSQSGVTVWLNAPFELCWRRILQDRQDRPPRPLAPNEETARRRYEDRLPLYRQAAIHQPVEEALGPDEIAASIIDQLQRHPGR